LHLTANATASAALVCAWLCLLRWARHSGWGIALLTLIGTIGHEALSASKLRITTIASA
jgi:hypothetical protein